MYYPAFLRPIPTLSYPPNIASFFLIYQGLWCSPNILGYVASYYSMVNWLGDTLLEKLSLHLLATINGQYLLSYVWDFMSSPFSAKEFGLAWVCTGLVSSSM